MRQTKPSFLFTHDIEEAIFLADRIVIMSANPGKVKSIMKVTPAERQRPYIR